MKKCKRCKKLKPFSDYYKHKAMGDGYISFCKECTKERINNYRYSNPEKDKEKDRYRIRENFNYIFLHRYAGIKNRVKVRSTRNYKVYGMPMCSKEEFFNWCEKNINVFKKIHKKWKENNYQLKFSPSIDRIDNNKGYLVENMQWLTQSENCKKYNK